MKILQVCQPAEGGVAHHTSILTTELKARGWSVDVACSPGVLADELRGRGVNVFLLPLVREASPLKDLSAVLQLRRVLREGKYSLVHTHSSKAGAIGRVAALLARVPSVHTPHAWSFLASKSILERWFYVAVEWLLGLVSSCIICVSTGEMELGRRSLATTRGKLRLVPNGVVVPARERVREEGNETEKLVVGTLARLTRQKGIDYLVQAAEEVFGEHEGVRFSVAGDGPDFEHTKAEIARRNLSGRFELVGLQDPWEYLEQIDIFVLSSLWEGMPFALLEAMAFGLPSVATDVGGVRDVIVDETFGIVVPPADTDALRDAVLRYVRSPGLRKAAGEAARRRIFAEFGQDCMVDRTRNLYSEVLGYQKNQRKCSS
jgi:glycosyltransferase involved in cell wall biosynthesis